MAGFAPRGMHHAGMAPYNPLPNVNYGNAGGGRPKGSKDKHASGPRGAHAHTLKLPAKAPAVGGQGFSFDRARAYQCESDVAYTVTAESDEGVHFTHWTHKVLEAASQVARDPIILAFNDAETLTIIEVKYSQLKRVFQPDWSELPSRGTAQYETYDLVKNGKDGAGPTQVVYAVSPAGNAYEVTRSQLWPWTFGMVVCGDVDFALNAVGEPTVRTIRYAVKLSVKKVPKTAVYTQAKPLTTALLVEYGEWASGVFCAWGVEVYVADKDMLNHIAFQAHWPAPEVPQTLEEVAPVEWDGEVTSSAKYEFRTVDDETCVWFPKPKKKDDEGPSGEWKRAGLAITEILAIYEWQDREKGMPYYLLKVHKILNQGEDVIYVTPTTPAPKKMRNTLKRIDAEVLIPSEVDDKTLGGCFSKVCAYLTLEAWFKKEHLVCWINQPDVPKPPLTEITTHFGRQPNSNLFVFGNRCYADGQVYTHKEKGVTILPQMFSGKDAHVPIPYAEYPKLLLVPQDWVRYSFFVDFWTERLPGHFINNTMQAKATFALGVMHNHVSKFWGGQAVSNMVPTGWLKSTEPNTGKTHAIEMVNCYAGFFHKGVMMGACSSLPGVIKRLTMQCDLPLCLDEVATKVNTDQEKSKKIKDIVHCVANGTTREVIGKSDKPLTTFIGTANIIVNEDDDAFLQRLIILLFKPLDTTGVDMSEGSDASREWAASNQLLSCLQPDLEQLLWEGTLDREALTDWTNFINKATSRVYSRNANLWGFVGAYMCWLELMAQGTTEDLDMIFEFLCRAAVVSNFMATKHSAMFNQFVLAINEVRMVASNVLTAEDRCLHWHNYRTTEAPSAYAFMGTQRFIAIRIEAVCNVIKRVLQKTFKPEEVRRAIEDNKDWAMCGKARFFKVAQLGFPISKQIVDDLSNCMTTVPLEEHELTVDQLDLQKCAFLQTRKFNQIVDEVDNVTRDAVDYKTIMITSANKDYGTYNFYEALTMRSSKLWYGWRSIGSTNFGKFCGAQNAVIGIRDSPELIPGIEEEIALAEAYLPSNLLPFFGYTDYPDLSKLPAPLRINPYVFRNDELDHQMPDDPRSQHYHTHLYEYDDDAPSTPRKRGRDDELRSEDSTTRSNRTTPSSIPSDKENAGVNETPPSGYEDNNVRRAQHPRTHALVNPPPHHFWAVQRRPRQRVPLVLRRVRRRDRNHGAAVWVLPFAGAVSPQCGGRLDGGHELLVDLHGLPLVRQRVRLDQLRQLALVELDRGGRGDVHDDLGNELVRLHAHLDLRVALLVLLCERRDLLPVREQRGAHVHETPRSCIVLLLCVPHTRVQFDEVRAKHLLCA